VRLTIPRDASVFGRERLRVAVVGGCNGELRATRQFRPSNEIRCQAISIHVSIDWLPPLDVEALKLL
jgi:hypothetical protein